jgi:MoxR-like ATPase
MQGVVTNGTALGAAASPAPLELRPVSSHVGAEWAVRVAREVSKAVVGQENVIERTLVALLADGHVLIEGMPGLAKTLLIRSLGTAMGLHCERVQFTPDLLPSDVVGTMVFQPQRGEFTTHLGPIFANLVLADEINRAPAKVQSALLEAMQERQVTIGGHSHALPRPFLVMATQNPIEQEGTYPLPEAQSDRFLFKLVVDYPSEDAEHRMLKRWGQITQQPALRAVSSADELLALRVAVDAVYVSEELQRYVLALVRATRASPPAPARPPTAARACSPSARHRAPRWRWSRRRAPSPSCAARTTRRRGSCRSSTATPSATASASPTRPKPSRFDPIRFCAASSTPPRCPTAPDSEGETAPRRHRGTEVNRCASLPPRARTPLPPLCLCASVVTVSAA